MVEETAEWDTCADRRHEHPSGKNADSRARTPTEKTTCKSTCEYVDHSPPPRHRARQRQTETSLEHGPEEPQGWSLVTPSSHITGGTQIQHASVSTAPHSTAPNTPTSQSSAREAELLNKIKQLETQLAKAGVEPGASIGPSPIWDSSVDAPQIAGTFHVNREAPSEGKAPTIVRTIMHKTRIFGQSHWIHGVTQEILRQCEPIMSRENSKAIFNLKKCKYLGKVIKEQRAPPWPTAPMSELPPKELADALVDIYLRTFECRYRVLHVPKFRQAYEALWTTEERDAEFVIQLKLVMAVGAVIYDENFSLRTSSIRWIYEAQTWAAEPNFKARLTIEFIQTNILLLLAREIIGFGVWGSPLLSLDDFDTHPPGNFDDEDLLAEDPTPKPDGTFTQMTIPLALRKMFEARLAIAASLNGTGPHSSYEKVLRLDTDLRASYKIICRTLQGYHSDTGHGPSPFQTQTLDFLMRRYLLALHIPFFQSSFGDTTYAFSRKVVIDTALQIWCTTNPASGMMITRRDLNSPSETDDLYRLTICGSGVFRLTSIQCCFLIAAELTNQLREEDNPGSVPLRRDLLTIIEDSREWGWKCLVAGETNTKGYLMLSLMNTQIQGLMARTPDDELPVLFMHAAEEALAKCLALFEEWVGEGDEVQMELDGLNEMDFESLFGSKGGWNFMVSEPFDPNADSMYWPGNWIA
ncbi:uncharacterized protein N7503_007799 [Penicillium pulvis]|uniref:uncharacterized protein n=1 Tax=Penicillium pulvis TaxID=1562058 RepID=UPI0025474372|nr:uncharacterized protein N7503_007799 [Penicillium pulvis]KAJ5798503.1 hypothetical protein N7503_007799 [Penicillium pulvis]